MPDAAATARLSFDLSEKCADSKLPVVPLSATGNVSEIVGDSAVAEAGAAGASEGALGDAVVPTASHSRFGQSFAGCFSPAHEGSAHSCKFLQFLKRQSPIW